jgi:hypothetical protein
VTSPDDALAHARAQAAARRSEGAYGDALPGFEVEANSRVTEHRLAEWALIEIDLDELRSTRRLGKPITWIKRGLARALRQYHGQALAQQSRFNSQVVAYLLSFDDRLRRLEERADVAGERPPPQRERPGA